MRSRAFVLAILAVLALEPMEGARFEATTDAACSATEARSSSCDARRRRRTHRRRPAPRRRPEPRPVVTASYIRMRQRWHRPPTALERRNWLAEPRPPLVLRPIRGGASFRLMPDAHGRFGETELEKAREAFRDPRDGRTIDVHPRLLELCYRAVRQFRAPYVHLVSGYRTTRSTSRHNQGRAMDIVLPGVSEERLAAFLRRQGFVGVGLYPNSGFTHLDVRARSYYWVDRSGPDQPSMTSPVRSQEIARNDSAARRRREEIVPDLVASATESEESGPTNDSGPSATEAVGPVVDAPDAGAP